KHVIELGQEAGDPDTERYKITQNWIACAGARVAKVRAAIESFADAGLIEGAEAHLLTAHFFADAGRRQRCAHHFEQAAREDFTNLAMDDDWLWMLCTAADVCARLGDARRARSLYDRILPYAHLNVTSSLFMYMGSAALTLGRLAFVLG